MQTQRILFFCLSFAILSPAADFAKAVATSLASAPKGQSAVSGAVSPWKFVIKELSHLSKGDLAQASDITQLNIEGTDPLPVIQEYASALKVLGVDLLLVPVPTKASIYPEKLASDLSPADAPSQKAFLDKIASTGIQVTDLETLFASIGSPTQTKPSSAPPILIGRLSVPNSQLKQSLPTSPLYLLSPPRKKHRSRPAPLKPSSSMAISLPTLKKQAPHQSLFPFPKSTPPPQVHPQSSSLAIATAKSSARVALCLPPMLVLLITSPLPSHSRSKTSPAKPQVPINPALTSPAAPSRNPTFGVVARSSSGSSLHANSLKANGEPSPLR